MTTTAQLINQDSGDSETLNKFGVDWKESYVISVRNQSQQNGEMRCLKLETRR
jgi:hypothetical protein